MAKQDTKNPAVESAPVSTESAPTTSAPSFDHAAIAAILGTDTITFNAGKGKTRESFVKPLSELSLAQLRKGIIYGMQQVFNDYRAPLLSKIKNGEATLPEGVEEGSNTSLFDYWWTNIFGQKAPAKTPGTPKASRSTPEALAIGQYLAGRATGFWALYGTTFPDRLSPKTQKPVEGKKPATLLALLADLEKMHGKALPEAKEAAIRAEIAERIASMGEEDIF